MGMERIDFQDTNYNPVEAAIHTARYRNTKPFIKGKKVLDAACGEGYGSLLMQMWGAEDVIGIDISATAIEKAKLLFANEHVRYIEHNVENLPFPDASFDVVASLETVEHLTNPEVFLKELRRVLKPGGTAIISCPNDHYYAQNIDDYTNIYHKRRYTWNEYKQLSEAAFGEAAQWLMGNSIFGFVNLPLEYCNDPEVDPRCPASMQGIMEVRPMETVESVPRGDYINHWVSVYYVGIWTEEKMLNHGESAVVYPAPFFTIHSDKKVPEVDPYDMVKKLDQRDVDLTEMQSKLWIQLKDAYTQLASEQLQKDAYKAKYDALTKKCAQIHELRHRLDIVEQKRNALEQQTEAIHQKLAQQKALTESVNLELLQAKQTMQALRIEHERTSHLLKIAEMNKAVLWNRINEAEAKVSEMKHDYDEYHFIQHSRAYRMVRKWWGLRAKVRHWMRRQD